MHLVRLFAAVVPILCACAAEPAEEADLQAAAEATHTTQQALLGGCGTERLIANAPEARKAILRRAAVWVDDPVPYSMVDWRNGHRQDCSGFVFMAWGKSGGMTTADLPPRDDDSDYAVQIEWGEMLPGDAVARGPNRRSEVGHVRLYAGTDHAGFPCYWEQTSWGLIEDAGTQINYHSDWGLYLDGYVPIRRK